MTTSGERSQEVMEIARKIIRDDFIERQQESQWKVTLENIRREIASALTAYGQEQWNAALEAAAEECGNDFYGNRFAQVIRALKKLVS